MDDDNEESYENDDFQSELDGPFSLEEQQWQEQLIEAVQTLEESFGSQELT